MTREEWVLENLEGKVQLRALRACDENPEWEGRYMPENVDCLFPWENTQEGDEYWNFICTVFGDELFGDMMTFQAADRYLPKNYTDAYD
jgi:hypothetical protein